METFKNKYNRKISYGKRPSLIYLKVFINIEAKNSIGQNRLISDLINTA